MPDFDDVIITPELARRPARAPDYAAENRALVALARTMADAPQTILQRLAETALELCDAHTAGISLLEEHEGKALFRWHAIAGTYARHLMGMAPRDFSPCGIVVDRAAPALLSYPGRRFPYLDQAEPRIAENLLIPFQISGQPVGTIWLIAHDEHRKFDAEDVRLMTTLGQFCAAAVHAVHGLRAGTTRLLHANKVIESQPAAMRAAAGRGPGVDRGVDAVRRAGEEQFATLVQNVVDYAIFMLDPDGRVTVWNEGAARLKGYTAEEIIGQHFSVFFTPEDRRIGKPAHEKGMAELNGRYEGEGWRVRKDGTRFWGNEIISAIRDGDGRLVGFTKVARDLSERRAMEEALRSSEERLRLLVENIRDHAVLTLDPAGNITSWNPGAERVFGYADHEIVGRYGSVLMTPEDRAAGAHEREIATAAAEGCASDDRWQMRKGGERFWASGVTTAMRDAAGTLQGFAKVCRDLTERKLVEEQMRSATEELERRVSERTSELVDYQRQLRSLVAELGRTEARERRRLATELHDNLAQLLAACKMRVSAMHAAARNNARVAREAEMVKEFLGEGIVYTRTLMADLRPEVLNDQDLAAAVTWLARRMERHGLTVRVEDDGEPKPLDDDTLGLLFESVRELLFNVVKHAGTGEATATLVRQEGTVRVTVADAGSGYDPARVTPPSEEGGFGLFSIRERLDLVGGSMEIASHVGGGTRVTLVAPLQAGGDAGSGGHPAADVAERAVAEGVEGSPTREDSRRLRVLLADDHRVVREGLRSLIQSQSDMEVVGEAADGAAAVELARTLRPDVVIMDVNMPMLSGVEATRRIAAEAPQVRVVGLSVREDKEVAAAMREAGAAAHLPKEGEIDALFAALRNLPAR